MTSSTRLGAFIAAGFAMFVVGYSLFGTRHESWFVRAAQNAAARCLTAGDCARINAKGEVVPGSPLATDSLCRKVADWHAVLDAKKRAVPFVVMCTDGAAYLYHMGKFRDAGAAQWMVCAEAECRAEVRLFGN